MFEGGGRARAFKGLAALDPQTLSDSELGEAQARMAATWDSRRVWEADGAQSGVAWLAHFIEVRDQFCYHEYCDVPAHRCQIDHIEPWAAGGITAQHNGRLVPWLCVSPLVV